LFTQDISPHIRSAEYLLWPKREEESVERRIEGKEEKEIPFGNTLSSEIS